MPGFLPGTNNTNINSRCGPPGGLGYDIRMHPDNLDVMYVTDAGAGVFRSEDGGLTWAARNEGIRIGFGDDFPVFCLTLDPNNPDRIWVGTSYSSGIFRSDDAGQSWTLMNNGIIETGATIRGFAVEPGNSDVVYVGGEISSWEWSPDEPVPDAQGNLDLTRGFVYRSEDGGQNWRRIWYGDALTRYILIHPDDHDLIYVSTGIFDRNAANSSIAAMDPGGVGILRTSDGGESWEVLAEGNGFEHEDLHIGTLVMHPTNPNILLAGAGQDSYTMVLGHPVGGVYITVDGGDHWTQTLELGSVSAVEFCPGDPDIAYAASIDGVHQSRDGGYTWDEMSGGLWGPDDVAAGFPIDMVCDPRDSEQILINNYIGGNFLSLDGGRNWVLASDGYTGSKIVDIEVAGDDAGTVFSTSRIGIFTSTDGGGHWEGLNYGNARANEGIGVAVDPNDADHIFLTKVDAGPNPLESFDGGQTWNVVETGFYPGPVGMVADIVFSPQSDDVLFALTTVAPPCFTGTMLDECDGGEGLLISQDGGSTWSQTNLSHGSVVSLQIAPEAGGPAYASVYGQGVYRSTDAGQTWELANSMAEFGREHDDPDVPEMGVWARLALDPNDSQRLFASLGHGGVVVSEDGGQSWRLSSAGLDTDVSMLDIVVDPVRPDVIYVASGIGVYLSTNGGQMWQLHNTGLTRRAASALAISDDGAVLYVGSNGGGVFRLGTPE